MSGPGFNPAGVNNAIAAVADSMMISPNGKLTPRQQLLNLRWSFYRREEYAGRAVDWNGHKTIDPIQRDAISMQGYLPPGFEDHGATLPLEFRRPAIPLGLVRIVVSRFTGLLFSDKRHPLMTVPGDQDSEDYLGALLKYGRFWSTMQRARNFGGGMGSVGIGFKFIDGKVAFECFDPRWATPEFVDCSKRELESIEIRYTYEKRSRDREGNTVTKKFWYRRWIDAQTDTIWEKVPVGDEEPKWNQLPAESTEHNLGFVPAEWIQNIPVDDAIDGDPDCQGGYELAEAIDAQLSQAHRGTLNNSDPTVFIASDDDLPALSKGSDHALKMGNGSSASYMEMNGQGATIAKTLSEMFEDRFYRLVQCVPESILFSNSSDKTATEIEREFSSMLEKADIMRGQYGPGIEGLCHKLLSAVRMMSFPTMMEDGSFIERTITLPMRVVKEQVDDGSGEGTTIEKTVEKPYIIGTGSLCVAVWGRYFPPSLNDIETAGRAVQAAKDGMMMDTDSAIRWLMPFYDLDPARVLAALKKAADDQAAADAAAADTSGTSDMAPPQNYAPVEIEGGLVTINEVRAGKGLGAIPGGDMTLPQYKASNPDLFVGATAATSKQAVDALFAEAGQTPAPATTSASAIPPVP